jgi:hypothetical protein
MTYLAPAPPSDLASWYPIGQRSADGLYVVISTVQADGSTQNTWAKSSASTGAGAVVTIKDASGNVLPNTGGAITLPAIPAPIVVKDASGAVLPNVGGTVTLPAPPAPIVVKDASGAVLPNVGGTVTLPAPPAPIVVKDASGAVLPNVGGTVTLPAPPAPVVLDGNDQYIVRTNATAGVAPTAIELPAPIKGDTTKVFLLDKSIEYWSHNGTTWTKDYTDASVQSTAFNPLYGTITDKAPGGETNAVANWGYIGDGTPLLTDRIYFAVTAANVNKTVTTANLKALLASPDPVVDVTGATLPIAFPVATIPGAPIFVPATPVDATAIYAITDGTSVVYAKWNGTQYISSPSPLASSFWSSNTAVASTAAPPNGVTDLTEALRRDGAIGIFKDPTSSIHGRTLGMNGTNSSAGAQTATDYSRIILGAANFTLLDPNIYPDRIIQLVNTAATPLPLAGTVQYINHLISSTVTQSSIPAKSCVTLQSIFNSTLVPNGYYWQLIDIGAMPATVVDEIVNVSGATLPIAFPLATIPGAPVFVPATPADLNAIYKFPNGQLAVWDGTNYQSYAAPVRDQWSSVTASANTAGLADGLNDLTEKLRRDGDVGIKTDAASTFDVAGSIGWGNVQVAASAAAYTIAQTDSTISFTGGFSGVGQVNFPAATTFPRRVITLRMPTTNTFQLNLISGGGNIEVPNYSLSGSARLNSAAFGSMTWQSDGTTWRLFNYDERRFYSTTGYTVPSSGFITFLGAGGVAPAPGVAFQIPANASSWLVLDANYVALVALPIGNTASGRFSVYVFNSAGFDTTISSQNTDLPRDTVVPAGAGRSMHFEWSDGLWRWVESPEPLSSGFRYQRRGTYAAPLTGTITVVAEDDLLIVAAGSTTTLPTPAAPNLDRRINIKKPGAGSASLLGNIDNVINRTLTAVDENLTLQSDGTTWMRI